MQLYFKCHIYQACDTQEGNMQDKDRSADIAQHPEDIVPGLTACQQGRNAASPVEKRFSAAYWQEVMDGKL